ncbi:hypothetical protein [Catalinimonas alkaloidigena]|nr:hypothetical protein [Catalinimonas alkaloidigena]
MLAHELSLSTFTPYHPDFTPPRVAAGGPRLRGFALEVGVAYRFGAQP